MHPTTAIPSDPKNSFAISSETILKYLPIPVVYIDAGLQIQFCNPVFQTMCRDYLGVPGESLIGKSIPELFPALPPGYFNTLKSLIQEHISFVKTGFRLDYPFEWTSATYWDLNLVPLPSEHTGEDGILILARDVTLRVNTDLALTQSEERIRRITDNLDVIIYRVGLKPAFHIDFVNSVVEKISGYPVEAFYQDPQLINRIIHPEDRNLPQQYFSEKIHGIRYTKHTLDSQRWASHLDQTQDV